MLAREKIKREPSQAYHLQILTIRDVDGRMKLTGAGLAGTF